MPSTISRTCFVALALASRPVPAAWCAPAARPARSRWAPTPTVSSWRRSRRPLAEAPARARRGPEPGRPRARGDGRAPRPRSAAPRGLSKTLSRGRPGRRQKKLVYDFAEGSRDMRDLLGGKGANVAEMTRVLGAERVPAGFTITTEACVAYMDGGRTEPDGLDERGRRRARRGWRSSAGKRLGDPDDPLLVSVRSGARESMPGMLDTVLNLGLNDRSVEGLARATGNERFAWDSYRRFVQMFGNVVPRHPGRALRGRDQPRARRGGRQARHRARRRRAAGARPDVQGALPRARPARTSRRTRATSSLRRSAPCSTPGLGERAVELPAHQPHPRRLGHGGERAADGVRQQGRRRRARASRSRATRSPARPSRPATSSPTPRARTSCRASAPRATSPSCARLMPEAHARADGDPAHARAPLRGHAGHRVHGRGGAAVTCSRRATRSGPRRPRCASRSTRSARGC